MSGPEKLRALVEALKEAEETLRLVERPAFPDPAHHDEVKRLGRRIGFGALMSTASAGWREVLEERGDPLGGEFVAGPCHSTVVYALRVIRAALTQAESSLASPAGMEGWMPIETAPKDGTNIVARDGRLTFVCRWNIDRACWWAMDCFHVFPKIWHLAPAAPRGEAE